ncbi:MAG: hypothetical protein IJF78_17305, partial [Clostridia bacterium]|nr:hypothetical protein [Clostridia bacterium]
NGLRTPDISRSMLRRNLESVSSDSDRELQYSITQLRIMAAGPLCGIAGVLVQGLTDYAWYNYRVYLMFWLMCGLASAFIRSGRNMLDRSGAVHSDHTSSDATILLGTGKDTSSGTAGKKKSKKEKTK